MGFLDKLFGKKEEPKMELAAPLAGEAVSISQEMCIRDSCGTESEKGGSADQCSSSAL